MDVLPSGMIPSAFCAEAMQMFWQAPEPGRKEVCCAIRSCNECMQEIRLDYVTDCW